MRPMAAAPPPAASVAVSPWHSPVPYLFGGLAAMLGLITLALLILACSYWKLNNYLGTGEHSSSFGASAGDGGDGGSKSPSAPAAASPVVFRDLVAVVMAGEKMPTFLAAPIVRRSLSTDTSCTAAVPYGVVGSPENRCDAAEGGAASRQPPHPVAATQAVQLVQL
ncbi:hypothetical protein E2562_024857 [Oryza meyeriana var. granulata]|uniref:Uncharacterized protein n=1 Tax=Oryza meyeriana var. granulata TaxID=110450 RepID=A0A6G1CJ90_9ORYZ|nr:hypothetical protein E2562_024857 [Oryza meyeriana var. granulata]